MDIDARSILIMGKKGEAAMVIAAPIRGLSAEVSFHTASAHKEFWDLLKDADGISGYVALPAHLQEQVVGINRSLASAVESQKRLIARLEQVSESEFGAPVFSRAIDELERLVTQGEAVQDDIYEMPDTLVRILRPNLNALAEQNRHIGSYAESFRMALDENCSALLAHLADSVLAER